MGGAPRRRVRLGWRYFPACGPRRREDGKKNVAARSGFAVDRHFGLEAAILSIEVVRDPRRAVHAEAFGINASARPELGADHAAVGLKRPFQLQSRERGGS